MMERRQQRLMWALGVVLIALGLGLPRVVMQAQTEAAAEAQAAVGVEGPYRPEMVWLPPGEFRMGTPDGELRDDDERAHTVVLTSSFAIARTEVTQAQWTAVMGTNPSYFQGDRPGSGDHPVERVSWFDALAYLNRLSQKEEVTACYVMEGCKGEVGRGCNEDETACFGSYTCKAVRRVEGCDGYRLPTEAEWEYAARAGTTTAVYTGAVVPTGEDGIRATVLEDIAWYHGNSTVEGSDFDCKDFTQKTDPAEPCGTQRVQTKRENPWGLFDMIGNVWEWMEDDFDEDYFGDGRTDAAVDPQHLTESGRNAVYRGCGFDFGAVNCRAADRFGGLRGYRYLFRGFRPSRSVPSTLDPLNP